MNNEDKDKQGNLKTTSALMKRFDESGHQFMTTEELYQLIMELLQIIVSKEDETRQAKEMAIRMLANSLGHGVIFTDKKKIMPKFRNPNNYDETWTGRGCRPVWVENHLKSGGKKEELKITD